MKKRLIVAFFVMSIAGCTSDKFWYPIVLKEVTCGNFVGEVYLMKHSTGWRSWPYYLDPTDKKEIQLGTDCVFKIIRRLPEHKRNLTDEQKNFSVYGSIGG